MNELAQQLVVAKLAITMAHETQRDLPNGDGREALGPKIQMPHSTCESDKDQRITVLTEKLLECQVRTTHEESDVCRRAHTVHARVDVLVRARGVYVSFFVWERAHMRPRPFLIFFL